MQKQRTRPEQLVGLGIYLSIALGVGILSGMTAPFGGVLYPVFLAFSMWGLWRRYSLRILKLELSVFLTQFFFQVSWSLSFFAFHQSLLALVSLLLLWCNILLATLLFWKKNLVSGLLLLFPLIWVFYLMGMSMFKCMSNSATQGY